jgi:hypothetical protein
VTFPRTPEVEDALARASDAVGLATHYRDCVRPLLGVGPARWPGCCGGGCEPGAETLIEVARRVHAILTIDVTRDHCSSASAVDASVSPSSSPHASADASSALVVEPCGKPAPQIDDDDPFDVIALT